MDHPKNVQRVQAQLLKIADGEAIDADVVHTVNFRFRLDLSQLPRPLQIGAVGSAGWSLMVTRNQRLVPEVAR